MNKLIKSDYLDSSSNLILSKFSTLLHSYIETEYNMQDNIVILCIGTDRSTGDSLGPLVGHKLKPMLKSFPHVELFGTLENPIHAQNLEETISFINSQFSNPFIIAIDSSLGRSDKIGFLSIKNIPLNPGAGVNKVLPEVGNISLTGIVNISGVMEYLVLQNTRLYIVMKMADIISKGLYLSLCKIDKSKESQKILDVEYPLIN